MAMIARRAVTVLRTSAPARNATGQTFPPVKIPGRPDVTETSHGQNKVREYAAKFSSNTVPTWCKAREDKMTNYIGAALATFSFGIMCRTVVDLTFGINKIE